MDDRKLATKCFTAFFVLLAIAILVIAIVDYIMPRRLLGHWAMNKTEYAILKEIDQGEIPDKITLMGEEEGILKVPVHVNIRLDPGLLFWLKDVRYNGVGGIYSLNGEYFFITWEKGVDWHLSIYTFLKRDGENLRIGLPTKGYSTTKNIVWNPQPFWPTK